MEPHIYLQGLFNAIRPYLNKNSIKEHDIKNLTTYLDNISIETSLMYRQKIETIYRITVNKRVGKERINNISFLKYPPDKNLIRKYGRLNFPGQQILYATFSPLVALSEMRPDIGDLVTVSTWKVKNDYYLNVSPIFKNTTKYGDSHNYDLLLAMRKYQNEIKDLPLSHQLQIDVFLQFVADCFTKDVDDNNHYDYLLSSYYANRLLYKFENGEIEALLYPSVRQSLTLSNIAIKPEIFDENYEIFEVAESLVTQKVNEFSSGWYLTGTGDSKKIDDNGEIMWNDYSLK